jgi:ABC-2 type transport system ATP-binding protein
LLAVLGPNGAGKSTAIACLLGLQEPDEGTATVFGESPHAIEGRRQVGAMLQNVDLPAELRVRELIDLSSSYYAAPLPLDEVLRLTFTTALANRPYAKLSGGQKRLVQFAIALCGRPKLLFLDEPTVGLDLQAREMLWATLRQLVANGCAVVLTTHYLEEAEALADRVAVLAKGKLVALGSVNAVRARVASTQMSCITALDAERVRLWPGVVGATRDGDRLILIASTADDVVRRLSQEDPQFRDLEVVRAGLAEAFAEITEEAA